MNSISDSHFSSRVEFARRFNTIAADRGVDSTGMLYMPDDLPDDDVSARSQRVDNQRPAADCTLIVPGLLGNSVRALVAPFLCARDRLTVHGYDIAVAWVSGRSGCEHNARVLREHVLTAADRTGKPINLIGYSKGCADAMQMLGSYADASECVKSLVSYAGIVHGTPLAESVAPWVNTMLRYVPLPGEASGDGRAIADLTRRVRGEWLAKHPLANNIRFASILAVPEPELVSRVLQASYKKLSAYDTNNDSQVIDHDALLPSGELLAVVNADHWAIALPIAERFPRVARLLVNRNKFPRDVLLQAIIDHLAQAPIQ